MPRSGFRLMPVLLVCLAVLVSSNSAPLAQTSQSDPAAPDLRVVRVYYEHVDDIRALMDFDLWEHNKQERYVLVAVDSDDFSRLLGLGLRIMIDDELTAEINAPREVAETQVAGIPGYPCYRTVEETFATAEQMVADHPGLASWTDVGDSWDKQNSGDGWDMMVLRLTNSAIPGPKPKLFITSSIHAREYAPAELATRFAEHLVNNYDTDADVTWILDYHEIHLMLMANPDARKQAETGLLWRKNTNQNYCSPTSNDRGADLNRNFEFEWGCCGGGSNNECSTVYRGPTSASEPEVQVIQAYLRAEFPDQRPDDLTSPAPDDATGVYLDIHSYGQLVLWPWGFGGNSPNVVALRTFGRKLAYFNGYEPEQAIELYPTDGTTIDFGYGDLGLATFAYEVGVSFFENCSIFEGTTLPDNLDSLFFAARVARTPYMSPAGPDTMGLTTNPPVVFQGGTIDVVATFDDTRFNNNNGTEPTQTIASAEYYLDLPPWVAGSPAPIVMLADDGSFDSSVESASFPLGTAGLDPGRHIIFVRGQDSDGNWGAVSATFLIVTDANADDDEDGVPNGVDCDHANPDLWASPGPTLDLRIDLAGEGNLSWQPPVDPGATTVVYDVLRANAGDGFGSADCVEKAGFDLTATDLDLPVPGSAYFYLVRSRNRCGENLGVASSGEPRNGASCTP